MKKITFILMLLLAFGATAQSHKKHHHGTEFDFTGKAGVNFCQIDGDGSGSYSHLGFNCSVNTSFPLGENGMRFQFGVGLSQKGSHVDQLNRSINLLYVEVPLMLTHRFLDDKLQIEIGVAPAILGKSKVTDNDIYNQEMSSNYRRMDILPACIGAEYLFGEHVGVGVRFNSSLLNIGIENGSGTYRIFRSNMGQFNRLISASVVYRL